MKTLSRSLARAYRDPVEAGVVASLASYRLCYSMKIGGMYPVSALCLLVAPDVQPGYAADSTGAVDRQRHVESGRSTAV